MNGSHTKKPCEHGECVIDHRFHPHWWILLTEPPSEAMPTRRKLLNVTTWKIIKVDLSELDDHSVLPGPDATLEGMIVVRERILVMWLLNLLTCQVVGKW
jgi:hypothetical protein